MILKHFSLRNFTFFQTDDSTIAVIATFKQLHQTKLYIERKKKNTT